jgi:hypothetical protein
MTEKSIDWQAAIDNYIQAQDNRHPELMPPDVFRASGVNGCLRQTVRNHLGKSSFNQGTLRHFQVGTVAHRFLQEKVGVGFVDRPVQFEVPCKLQFACDKFYEDGLPPAAPRAITITGHIDCWDGETVYDFKTTSNVKLSSSNVMKGYLWQASIYALAKGAERAEVVYIDKRSYEVVQVDITDKLIPVDEIQSFMEKVINAEDEYKHGRVNPDGTQTINILPEFDDCFNCKQEQKENKKEGCECGLTPPHTEELGGRI